MSQPNSDSSFHYNFKNSKLSGLGGTYVDELLRAGDDSFKNYHQEPNVSFTWRKPPSFPQMFLDSDLCSRMTVTKSKLSNITLRNYRNLKPAPHSPSSYLWDWNWLFYHTHVQTSRTKYLHSPQNHRTPLQIYTFNIHSATLKSDKVCAPIKIANHLS